MTEAERHPALEAAATILWALGIADDERIALLRLMGSHGDRRPVQNFGTAGEMPGFCADDGSDVFFCSAVFRDDALERKVAGIERLTALPADLDYKAEGVIDEAGAQLVMENVSAALHGRRPTFVVHSGHGQQPYWTLAHHEVSEVPRAAGLQRRFGVLVRTVAESHGLAVDSTFTPERVWRVPGTRNHKDPDAVVRVEVEYSEDPVERLSLDELALALDEQGIPEVPPSSTDLISPPEAWPEPSETCGYAVSMVEGWASDRPSGRHPWLISQCVRLACAKRMGCITTQDVEKGFHQAVTRFRDLMEAPGYQRRSEGLHEVGAAWTFGCDLAATKTDAQCWAELGGTPHQHQAPDGTSSASKGRLPDEF